VFHIFVLVVILYHKKLRLPIGYNYTLAFCLDHHFLTFFDVEVFNDLDRDGKGVRSGFFVDFPDAFVSEFSSHIFLGTF